MGTGGVASSGGSPSTGGATGTGGGAGGTTTGTGGQTTPDAGTGLPDSSRDLASQPDSAPDRGAAEVARDGATVADTSGGTVGEVPLDPTLLTNCSGSSPILCAIPVANGNYNVTVELGSPTASATTRVLAETRRIVLQPASTAAGS
jgi:hypothetical protein